MASGCFSLQRRSVDPEVHPTCPSLEPDAGTIGLGDRRDALPAVLVSRACPRVAAWPRTTVGQVAFREAFCTTARRVHAIELSWLAVLSTTALYRYRFDAAAFRPWSEASGQWITDQAIKPIDVERMPDLAQCHVNADIELRAMPSLWPIRDLACSGPWDFSVVRFTNARPN